MNDLSFSAVAAGGGHEHAQGNLVADGPNASVTKQKIGRTGMNAAETETVIWVRGIPNGAQPSRDIAA
jgi:hypothetical protein